MNNTHAAPFVGRYRTRRDEVERIILALAVESMNQGCVTAADVAESLGDTHVETVDCVLTMAVAADVVVLRLAPNGDNKARYIIDAHMRGVMLRVGVRAWLEARLGLVDCGHDHMGDACTLSTANAACDHCGEPATRAAHGGNGMAAYSCERCCVALQRAKPTP